MAIEKERNEDPQVGNGKKVYTPPTLSEYGSVSKLTKGPGSIGTDGASGMAMSMG
jgi:hypothetical protein